MTVSDLIIAAIQRVTSGGDLPSPDDVTMALARLNDLIDAWKIEGLTTWTITRTTWALTSAATYSVGATGTIAIDRPINGQSLDFGLLDNNVSPAFERRMINYTDDQYHSVGFKALTAPYPQGFYYNPTTPTGTISPWPIPTAANLSGVIYAPAPAGEVGLSDTLALPQGYRRFYRDNLAVEIAPDFDLQPSPVLLQSAIDSKALVKRANVRLGELTSEAASLGGGHPSWNQSAFFAGA